MFKVGDHFVWRTGGEANVVIAVHDYLGGPEQFVEFDSVSNGPNSMLLTWFVRKCSRLEYSLLATTKDV